MCKRNLTSHLLHIHSIGVVAVALASCGHGNGQSEETPAHLWTGGGANLGLQVTVAHKSANGASQSSAAEASESSPQSPVTGLGITIDRIEIERVPFGPDSGKPEWIVLDESVHIVNPQDLMDDAEALLLTTGIEPGHYTALRVRVLDVTIDTESDSRTFAVAEEDAVMQIPIVPGDVDDDNVLALTVVIDESSLARLFRENTHDYIEFRRAVEGPSLASISGMVLPGGLSGSVTALLASTGSIEARSQILPDGSYSLFGLPALDADGLPIPYTVHVSVFGYETESVEEVTLEPHEVNTLDDFVLNDFAVESDAEGHYDGEPRSTTVSYSGEQTGWDSDYSNRWY